MYTRSKRGGYVALSKLFSKGNDGAGSSSGANRSLGDISSLRSINLIDTFDREERIYKSLGEDKYDTSSVAKTRNEIIEDILIKYGCNKLKIITKIKKEEDECFKVHIELSRVSSKQEHNHTIPVSFFLECIANFFNTSEDFFIAAKDLFDAFERLQDHSYYSYITGCYKNLSKSSSASEVKEFLNEKLIPFVFFVWNERFASSFEEFRTTKELGHEGAKVKSAKKEFLDLLDDCNSLDKFKKNIVKAREKCFKILDIPPIVRSEWNENSSNYLIKIFKCTSSSFVDMLKSNLIEQIEESLCVSDELLNILRKAEELLSSKKYGGTQVQKIKQQYQEIDADDKDQWTEFFYKFEQIYKFERSFNPLNEGNDVRNTKCKSSFSKLVSLYEDNQKMMAKTSFKGMKKIIEGILKIQSLKGKDLKAIRKDIIFTIIADIRELLSAWVFILEIKHKENSYYNKEDYRAFLQHFFGADNFANAFFVIRDDVDHDLQDMEKIRNVWEEDISCHRRISTIPQPPLSSKASTLSSVGQGQGCDSGILNLVLRNLKNDLYNSFLVDTVFNRVVSYRNFKVSVCTTGEAQLLGEVIKHEEEVDAERDDLLIIKDNNHKDDVFFKKYVIGGREYELNNKDPCSAIEEILEKVAPIHSYSSLDEHIVQYYKDRMERILSGETGFYEQDIQLKEPFIYIYVTHLINEASILKKPELLSEAESLVNKTYRELRELWDESEEIKGSAWYSGVANSCKDDGGDIERILNKLAMPATLSGHLRVVESLVQKHNELIGAVDVNGDSLLHCAAYFGHLEVVKFLVKKGASLQRKNGKKNTPLHSAASEGNKEVVDFLIETLNKRGVLESTINEKNSSQEAPLHLAASKGNVQAVKALMEEGADLKSQNNKGNTPLHSAAISGRLGAAKALTEKSIELVELKNEEGNTPLYCAATMGHLKLVEHFIQKKSKLLESQENCYSDTALHGAAFNSHIRVVEFLTKRKRELLSIKNDKDEIPLHKAAMKNCPEVVRFLIRQDRLVDSKNSSGSTALHTAASQGHLEVVEVFVEEKTNLNVKNGNNGNAPLHDAVYFNHGTVVEYLVGEGAAPDAKNDYGNSPVHFACQDPELVKIAEFFMEKSPSLICNNFNHYGDTPLHSAVYRNNIKLVRSLIEKDRQLINIRNLYGDTLLHSAVVNFDGKMVEFLMKNSANPNHTNDNQDTPLHIAAMHGSKQTVKYLLEHGCNPQLLNVYLRNCLHSAILYGNNKVFNFFCSEYNELGASKDTTGHTPLDFYEFNKECLSFPSKRSLSFAKSSILGSKVKSSIFRKIGEENDDEKRGSYVYKRTQASFLYMKSKFERALSLLGCSDEKSVELSKSYFGSARSYLVKKIFNSIAASEKNSQVPNGIVESVEAIILGCTKNANLKLEKDKEERFLKDIKSISERGISLFLATDEFDGEEYVESVYYDEKRQEVFSRLSEFVSNHFPNASIESVRQGLYLPSFEKRGVKINGKCTTITRSLSRALLSQGGKSFLSNLETSVGIYERIAQGKQIFKREEREVFALSKLLNNFERQLDSSTNSLPSNLIHTQGYKTFSGLSNYITGVKGDFAIHLVTSNHVIAIYRTGDNYAYFDSNAAFVSGLKSVDQLMQIVEKAVKFAGYEVGEKGFLIEHFDVDKANDLLSDEDKQVLTKEIKTEHQLLAEQDKELGFIKINGQELSRVQLYDFGTKINVEGSVPLLINAEMNLSSKKFQDHLDKKEVSMTAREYLDNLKNSKNVEEVAQATKFIPFIGSKSEIEEAEQTREPKRSLLERLVKGAVNFIASNLTTFFTNVSQSESQLPGKTDNKPQTYLNDPTVDNQSEKSL